MRKSRFSEAQIVAALRQAEGGVPVAELCRKLAVTETTFYRWKRQYGGMGVSELRELRQLRDENRKLKQVVADLSLDKTILQESLRKKWEGRRHTAHGSAGSETSSRSRRAGPAAPRACGAPSCAIRAAGPHRNPSVVVCASSRSCA
jgi:putative transposase